jgi:hypothetical protein
LGNVFLDGREDMEEEDWEGVILTGTQEYANYLLISE